MLIVSALLALLAVLLAWPVPVALSRATWPALRPVSAMILWQSIALAGGLSMLGALTLYGLSGLGHTPWEGSRNFLSALTSQRPQDGSDIVHIFALSTAALLWAHLVFTLILTGLRMAARRRRHIEALRLVAEKDPDATDHLILDSSQPLAYCVPSTGGSVTVLTRGLRHALNRQELQAVIDHERAHIEQRHDFLIWAFSAWRTALPWLPTSRLALKAVGELIEYLADDASSRKHPERTIARALLLVAESSKTPLGAAAQNPDGYDRAAHGPTSSSGESPQDGSHLSDTSPTLRRALRLVERARSHELS